MMHTILWWETIASEWWTAKDEYCADGGKAGHNMQSWGNYFQVVLMTINVQIYSFSGILMHNNSNALALQAYIIGYDSYD